MVDLMAFIQGRRSVRRYEARVVPLAMVEQVLEALRWAPLGCSQKIGRAPKRRETVAFTHHNHF